MEIQLDQRSQAVLDFANEVRHRALGNAEDQRVLSDLPSRLLEFGILFSTHDAQESRRGIRSVFKPAACSVRFEVPREALDKLQLRITPSFWVYFRRQDQLDLAVLESWDPQRIFASWTQWGPPSILATQPLPDGVSETWVRARYARTLFLTSVQLGIRSSSLNSDIQKFRRARRALGSSPEWSGELRVQVSQKENSNNAQVTIQLVNTYNKQRRFEPAWFDVRLRIGSNLPIEPVFCPLLDGRPVYVQTTNCTLDTERSAFTESEGAAIEVEQIALVKRMRQQMIPIEELAFASASGDSILAAVESFAREASSEHTQALRNAVQTLRSDTNALNALDVVAETLGQTLGKRTWYRHQAAILVLSAAHYLLGGMSLEPLVINVPTAGGKTEAFTAAALWTVAYERLARNRLGVTIIKYPTTMLSMDQSRRLAHLLMNFDQIIARWLDRPDDRGLGLFFGPDPTDNAPEVDPTELLGTECPECGAPWRTIGPRGERRLVCTKNTTHSVRVAIRDEIFPRPPSLIAATIDKFVSKARKADMMCLFGGPLYWCTHRGVFTASGECWDDQRRSYQQDQLAEEQPLLTSLVIDEAHLLREDVGSLDSHFETHYLEMARTLGGRYPLVIVSTATIAQVKEHSRQLGLGLPMIFPGEVRDNNSVYYRRSNTEIQHVVLGCVPRGRAIAHALPRLYGEYLRVGRASHETFTDLGLKPPLIYCNTYSTRDQIVSTIREQINPELRKAGLPGPEIEEFSRRRFDKEGVREILRKLNADLLDGIVTTNIASVGVDLGQLNAIFYFAMPPNISEFIQSLNRVGRRDPAIACLVLNPYLERDMAFYAYLQPFLDYPERLVEAVPLNRWARRAIDYTFDTIGLAQILQYWNRQMPRGVDLQLVQGTKWKRGFRDARGRELNENKVVELLQLTYRANGDPSGVYPDRVISLWSAMATNISTFRPSMQKLPGRYYDDNRIWYTPQLRPMWQLRSPEREGHIEWTSGARALVTAGTRAIFASDADEQGEQGDEVTEVGTSQGNEASGGQQ